MVGASIFQIETVYSSLKTGEGPGYPNIPDWSWRSVPIKGQCKRAQQNVNTWEDLKMTWTLDTLPYTDPSTENSSLLIAQGAKTQSWFSFWLAVKLRRQWRKSLETKVLKQKQNNSNNKNKKWTKTSVATYHEGNRFNSFSPDKFINKETNNKISHKLSGEHQGCYIDYLNIYFPWKNLGDM